MGCFNPIVGDIVILKFPSPCGVWVVSDIELILIALEEFPSPCGVWVVSWPEMLRVIRELFPSPCGVWVVSEIWQSRSGFFRSFRPLAGCGLFRFSCDNASGLAAVSVPLRGVGCFSSMMAPRFPHLVSVPLRGVGCFRPPG